VDAFVHFHLASAFEHTKTSTLSGADLFHLEAIAAVIAAVPYWFRPRRYTAAFAYLVACDWNGSGSGILGMSTSERSVRSRTCTTPTGPRPRRR
jgi:hypothetical protein